MKRIISRIAMTTTVLLSCMATRAQMPYNVVTLQQPYTSLTNATDITGSVAWSDTATFHIPVGFNVQWGRSALSSIVLSEANLILPALSGNQSGFAILGTTLQDRNYQTGTGVSPIRYQVSGTNGSRIFKMEIRNAGFTNERELYNTSHDSVNFQVWLFESNSAVEFHFGTSSITHFADYFQGKVPLGYMKHLDMDNFIFDKYYTLSGDPLNPGMDTLTNLNNVSGLNSFPASGTVYRFTPKNSGTAIHTPIKATLGKIYPVPAREVLFVESQADTYEIVNRNGSVSARGKLNHAKASISLQGLVPGMYFIRLTDKANQVDVQKFIKQ